MNASARLLATGVVFGLFALLFYATRSPIFDGYEPFGRFIYPVLIAGTVMVALLAFIASHRVSRAMREGSSNQWLMRFEHPELGQQTASVPWFWAAVFSFPYFVARGVWVHVLLGVLFIVFTGGIGNLFQAVFANYIIRKHYEKRGYVMVPREVQPTA